MPPSLCRGEPSQWSYRSLHPSSGWPTGAEAHDQEMDSDAYGIPENMFGQVPEAFYGMLRRVVIVASMLEQVHV